MHNSVSAIGLTWAAVGCLIWTGDLEELWTLFCIWVGLVATGAAGRSRDSTGPTAALDAVRCRLSAPGLDR